MSDRREFWLVKILVEYGKFELVAWTHNPPIESDAKLVELAQAVVDQKNRGVWIDTLDKRIEALRAELEAE